MLQWTVGNEGFINSKYDHFSFDTYVHIAYYGTHLQTEMEIHGKKFLAS